MPGAPVESHIRRLIEERGGFDALVDRIASGETVTKIAKEFTRPDGQPISRNFLSMLLHDDPERSKRIKQAHIDGAAAMVDDALDAVDNAAKDRDSVNHAKVRAETRIKVAGLIDRERWGESKQQVNVQVNVATLHLDALRSRVAPLQGSAVEVTTSEASSLPQEATNGGLLAPNTSSDAPHTRETAGELA